MDGNEIRYLCISDMHLGEEDSILNRQDELDSIFYPSPVLNNLKECLDDLLSHQSRKPTLILNGDILELALGETELSAMMFERFMELVLENGKELFDEVIYIPGNHDHHIWEAARETQYERYILRHYEDNLLPAPWHRTGMVLGQTPAYSSFLNSVIRRHNMHQKSSGGGIPLKSNLKVQLFYPNLAIQSKDGKRCAIFHHGHFAETAYCLMSYLSTILTEKREFPRDIDGLERENFAWIDFFWSALGRSGDAGDTVETIYEYAKNPKHLNKFFNDLSDRIASRCDIPRIPGDWLEAKALKRVLPLLPVEELLGERGRRSPSISQEEYTLSKDMEDNLVKLLKLSWPLMKDDISASIGEVILVYGHTHKPLSGVIQDDGLGTGRSISVYNTGGWVVEKTVPDSNYGATLVLLNEDLDHVTLEMYREGKVDGVRVNSIDKDCTFAKEIEKRITSSKCWYRFSISVRDEIKKIEKAMSGRL